MASTPLVLELVHLRAGQINGCSPCVFAGVQSAKKHGESEERLHNVVTWRETPFFTEQERAALALTEAATRIQDGAPGVTDEIGDAAATHLDENQMSAIILNIAITNFFNRINHTIREPAGKTWWRRAFVIHPEERGDDVVKDVIGRLHRRPIRCHRRQAPSCASAFG
ncbi:carboxymuconolactone decarboxylase family protein [Spongiactinospora rosea]|uniref:carboxymuconolactone decarboxylase family protein n=1 Tax=Spongiactinospora rosea TaxID=2248750 RepID=UPI0026A38B7A|nr:carboxymuconolactone decarboxylase family protein [Spongiactinospora rosea]